MTRQQSADLDATLDSLTPDARAAEAVFDVVDTLESSPALRRTLSDSSASADSREQLARTLLAGKIPPVALDIVIATVRTPWAGPRRLVSGLERQGVRAALRIAHGAKALETVQAELGSVITLIHAQPELSNALRNPRPGVAQRRRLLETLIAGRVSATTSLLVARSCGQRSGGVQATLDSYLTEGAAVAGQQIANVTVAKPLDAARAGRLRRLLEARTGRAISLQIRVDPAVLGGINVQIADHIYEASVAGRLADARRLLTTS
ncbi:MAG: ATP synthase F1 subunit delta [Arachnia sp.]